MDFVHLIFAAVLFASAKPETVCDNGWHHFKHGLCLKYVSKMLTYEQAVTHCSVKENATLLMVKDSDLQLYLTYTVKISDSVWLGAILDGEKSKYAWNDGTLVGYTDWEVGYPKDTSDSGACVELNPANDTLSINTRGKWTNVNCSKLNSVICQRTMESSVINAVNEIAILKKYLLDSNKLVQEMQVMIQEMQQDQQTTRNELTATQEALQNTSNDLRTTTELNATKSDLQVTKQALLSTQSKLQANNDKLEATQQRLEKTDRDVQTGKVQRETVQADIQATKSDIQAAKSDIQAANANIQSTKQAFLTINQNLQTTSTDLHNAKIYSETTRRDLNALSTKVVPVGYIYIEYYNQPNPRSLWPNYSWQDISSTYAGHFFRVLGGNAAGWGTHQSDCSPRMSEMTYKWHESTAYPDDVNTNKWWVRIW